MTSQIKRVAVIGGAGFIGSHLVDALIDRRYHVRIVDNLDPQVHSDGMPPSYMNPSAEFIRQTSATGTSYRTHWMAWKLFSTSQEPSEWAIPCTAFATMQKQM